MDLKPNLVAHPSLHFSGEMIFNWKPIFAVYLLKKTLKDYLADHYSITFEVIRRPSCHTLSNVFDKSRIVPQTTKDGFASQTVKTSCVMAIGWCILGSLGRNTNWLLFKKKFSCENSWILSSDTFSNIFEHICNKDTSW